MLLLHVYIVGTQDKAVIGVGCKKTSSKFKICYYSLAQFIVLRMLHEPSLHNYCTTLSITLTKLQVCCNN